MGAILKYKYEIIFGLLITSVFFLVRLPNLTSQPIFADEAIYIRWAQIMKSEPTLRFVSLSDGKTPLFMWMMMPLFKIFDDPLFAGRILSVFSGLFTLAGVFALSWKVFGKKVAFWSALIYAVVPYTVFFDRMALVDSMLAAFTIWSVFIAIWLLKSPRLDLAMILGYLLGAAWLTKTPAFANLIALPFTIVGLKKIPQKNSLVKLLIFWIVAIVIALGIYNTLRLGPNFASLASRNQDYIFSPLDLIGRPLDPFVPHLRDMADWFPKLFTWPIFLLIFLGIGSALRSKNRLSWAVFFWALVPMVLLVTFLKTFTARYLLLSIPLLITFAGLGAQVIWNTVRSVRFGSSLATFLILMIIILALPLRFDYLLLTDIQNAPLPAEERRGYLEEWTAGYNFKDIAEFMIQKKTEGPVVVGTEGFFGTLPDGLQIYLDKSGITVLGSTSSISAQLREAAKTNTTYFVGNESRIGDRIKNVTLVNRYEKAKPLGNFNQDAIVVYQVHPE